VNARGAKADWFRNCSAVLGNLAAGVLAIATYFHHMRLLGLFAILATVFAAFLRRTIAGGMRTLIFRVLSHKTSLLSSD
jgi:hypothetical protein